MAVNSPYINNPEVVSFDPRYLDLNSEVIENAEILHEAINQEILNAVGITKQQWFIKDDVDPETESSLILKIYNLVEKYGAHYSAESIIDVDRLVEISNSKNLNIDKDFLTNIKFITAIADSYYKHGKKRNDGSFKNDFILNESEEIDSRIIDLHSDYYYNKPVLTAISTINGKVFLHMEDESLHFSFVVEAIRNLNLYDIRYLYTILQNILEN